MFWRAVLVAVCVVAAVEASPSGSVTVLSAQTGSVDIPAHVCKAGVDSALGFTYAHVFGMAASWEPRVGDELCWTSLPVTDVFARPQAGLVVVSPGLRPEDVGKAGASQMLLQAVPSDGGRLPKLACTSQSVFVSDVVDEGQVDGSVVAWSPTTSSWSVPAAATSDARTLLEGALPCTPTGDRFMAAAGFPRQAAAAGCAYKAPNGVSLDAGNPAVHRAVAEAVLLLGFADHADVLFKTSKQCPAVLHLHTRGVAQVANGFGQASPQRDAVAKLVTLAISAASAAALEAKPAASAVAVLTGVTSRRPATQRRRLEDDTPTATEIGYYQLVLWTAVGLVITLIIAVNMLVNMDLGRDPQLYNQFKNDNELKRD